MRLFWEFSGQVPRLLADEQRGQLKVAVSAQGGPEAVAELERSLLRVAPEPITLTVEALIEASSVRDQEGFDSLRALAG